MSIIQSSPVGLRGKISYFFRQTFRRHTGEEYSEFFTRGFRDDDGVNKVYPWAYIRVYTLLFILYAVFILIVRFTSNEMFTPTINAVAAIVFSLSFLVLLYELYPGRDLSLMAVVLALLIGGAGANVVTQILYSLFKAQNSWMHAVYAGFFEELPKAAATVMIIVVSRKKSPFAGFVFGAAVGCGFSISEDMGYVFMGINELPVLNLTTIIEISLSRGLSAFCTHILWTGAVGWVFNLRNKWLSKLAFYLMLLLSCGLHIAWDLPLDYFALAFVYAGCAAVAISEAIFIVWWERRRVFKEEELIPPAFLEDSDVTNKSMPVYWSHASNLTLTIAAFLMAVIAVIYCSIPFRETYSMQDFSNSESFISYMQDDIPLNVKYNRAYNEDDKQNDVPSGEYIVQSERETVLKGDREISVVYEYMYYLTYDMVGNRFYQTLYKTMCVITDDDGERSYVLEDLYHPDTGVKYASFFHITDSVISGYYFRRNGNLVVYTYDPAFEMDLSEPQYLVLFMVFVGIFGAAAICFTGLKIKSWRVKKLCSKKDVSSAE